MTRTHLHWTVAVATAGALLGGVALSPVTATAAPSPRGAVTLPGIVTLDWATCPTTKRCVAVGDNNDGAGKSAVVTASTGKAAAGPGTLKDAGLNSVACPGPTTCLAVSDDEVATVKVANGALKLAATVPAPKTGIVALTDVSCPNSTTCYAVGFEGLPDSATAIIVDLSSSGAVRSVSKADGTGIGNITCVTSSRCLYSIASKAGVSIGVLNSGKPGTEHALPKNDYVQRLACYGAKACFAIGGNHTSSTSSTDDLIPVNPVTGAIGKIVPLGSFNADDIACDSATQCWIVGFTGSGATAVTSTIVVNKGKPGKPAKAGGESLAAVACPTPKLCYGFGLGKAGAIVERL